MLCQLLLSYAMSAPIILCYVCSYCPMLCRLLLSFAILALIVLCYKTERIQNVVILGFVSIFCCMNEENIYFSTFLGQFFERKILSVQVFFDSGIISSTLFRDHPSKMQSRLIRGKEKHIDYGKKPQVIFISFFLFWTL